MKVVILCGGLGTRLVEETKTKPKPMVKIGSKPILWHIIKYYKYFGYNDFILATGYKYKIIENYFFKNKITNCKIKSVYTGKNTLTGGRILRLREELGPNDFMLTYGDGLSNLNIKKLLSHHKKNKGLVTLTAVRPPVRFGEIKIGLNDVIKKFKEKPQATKNWINGGFFVVKREIFDFLKNDMTIFEKEPMENLVKKNKLIAFRHYSFWQCMDTMRDKLYLEKLWKKNKAPWKKW